MGVKNEGTGIPRYDPEGDIHDDVSGFIGEITDVVEKPADPPSNLVMTGFYTFSPAIFDACRLVQPSNRGEYEISEAIDLLIRSGRTIDAVRLDGWRIDVGYPEDREEAERRLQQAEASQD